MLRITILLSFTLLLCSCSNLLKPKYEDQFSQRALPKEIPLKYQNNTSKKCYSANQYLEKDNQLRKLLELSNFNNYDLEEERLNLRIQQAKEKESFWNLFPSPSASFNQSKSKGSSENNISNLGITLPNGIKNSSGDTFSYNFGINNYEVDLFGKKKGRHESFKQNVVSAEHRVNSVKIKLRSSILKEYFNLRIALRLKEILTQKIAIINQSYSKSLELFKNQKTNRLKVGEDLISIRRIELLILEIEEAINLSYNQLYFLTGDESLLNKEITLNSPLYIPIIHSNNINISSSILSKRPDLLIREQQIKIDNEQIGIARADYLPLLHLNANYNNTTGNKGELFDNISDDLRFGTSVNYSFDFGEKSAVLEQATINKEKSKIKYNKVLYRAFLEVKNIISNIEKLTRSINVRKNILNELEKQLSSVRRMRAVNHVSLTNLLKYEDKFLTEELELFRSYSKLSQKSVALYEALGGEISLMNLCYADTYTHNPKDQGN